LPAGGDAYAPHRHAASVTVAEARCVAPRTSGSTRAPAAAALVFNMSRLFISLSQVPAQGSLRHRDALVPGQGGRRVVRALPSVLRRGQYQAGAGKEAAPAPGGSSGTGAGSSGRALRPSGLVPLRFLLRLLLREVEGDGVHAVPLSRRRRAVVEDVSEVRAAAGAVDLDAVHPVAVVVDELDVLPVDRLGEARPSGAGLELRVRREQLAATRGTSIEPVALLERVLPGEGSLGALEAQDLVLLGGEPRAPLLLGSGDAGVHGDQPPKSRSKMAGRWLRKGSCRSPGRASPGNAGGTPRPDRTPRP